MDILTRAELEGLMGVEQKWCVSIFLPTHRKGPEILQDPILFKNLLRDAEEQLVDKGMRRPEALKLLEPARAMVKDTDFWQHQSDGLAFFLSSDWSRYYRLELSFKEMLVVAERFAVKPMFPLFSNDGQFYILALSQNDVRLLRGSRFNVSEVDTGKMPRSLLETLSPDNLGQVQEKHFTLHSGGSPGSVTGSSSPVATGQGGAKEYAKQDILQFLHRVEKGLLEIVKDDKLPLVLAGVEYLLSIYREINKYPNVAEKAIKGNPDLLSSKELHKNAWDIVGPQFLAEQKKAAERFEQLYGQGSERVADALERIVPAAHSGQVEILFVASGVQRWGTFDRTANEVQLHDQAGPGDEGLLDLAAALTFMNGGTVYSLEADHVPGGKPVAAIFRY
ncbi:MAG: hypothetical protein H6Q66_324 [Firmicutes bacterium]|nr:hypothetical protein [Bacillota bacterium]